VGEPRAFRKGTDCRPCEAYAELAVIGTTAGGICTGAEAYIVVLALGTEYPAAGIAVVTGAEAYIVVFALGTEYPAVGTAVVTGALANIVVFTLGTEYLLATLSA